MPVQSDAAMTERVMMQVQSNKRSRLLGRCYQNLDCVPSGNNEKPKMKKKLTKIVLNCRVYFWGIPELLPSLISGGVTPIRRL